MNFDHAKRSEEVGGVKIALLTRLQINREIASSHDDLPPTSEYTLIVSDGEDVSVEQFDQWSDADGAYVSRVNERGGDVDRKRLC